MPGMEAKNSNVSRAEEIKVQANEAFKAHKYAQAIDLYTQAIELNSNNAVYWANRAFAHTKLEEYGSAIQDASKAIEVDPKYSKGYYRRGAAYLAMGKFKEALKDFQQVKKICPNDPDATKKLKECEKAVMKLKFEEAIAAPESERHSVADSIDFRSVEVEPQYSGARIDGDVVTLDFAEMQRIQHKAMTVRKHTADIVAHDYTSSLFPYFDHWRKEYGLVYTYSTGSKQHLYVNHPELVKEMNQCNTLDLGKPSYVTKRLGPMLGNGIIRSNSHQWAQQRKIIAAEFFMDKVKAMVRLMLDSAQPVLRKWEEAIEAQGGMETEIRVDEDLRSLSADVIARACFGSSYFKGKEIFSKLRSLQKVITKQGILFNVTSFGERLFPNKKKTKISDLESEIETLIWETVKQRGQECSQKSSHEKDLMQSILEGAVNDRNVGKISSRRFIVDNCKNIYFAGHETTAVAASWCLMLLALHPEWQTRIRAEVAQFCKNGLPDSDSIPHLKTVTMVIQETLRLYPPAAFVSREALADTRIGNIIVPQGVCIWTLIPTLHRDPDIWGPDANKFKPERFSDGVSKACKHPEAYVPFGLGTRLCLGRNFAMVQLKLLLSLIVSKFAFSLSPSYRHSPTFRMIVEPEHGVVIRFQKI